MEDLKEVSLDDSDAITNEHQYQHHHHAERGVAGFIGPALIPTTEEEREEIEQLKEKAARGLISKPRTKLSIEKEFFVEEETGRVVILRGVNLGGDCKVPFPNGGTHIKTNFEDHRNVSFIGRPFPLEDAHEHFQRLQRWGFNCLRLLTTWEALEHKGPNEYDYEYLDYFTTICKMAGDYGFYVFIDFHQDAWSRMTGGDGAPGWIFEKLGLDFKRFGDADAALVMQYAFDYSDRRDIQPERYPQMRWFNNYRWPANGIMWTLFFGGKEFTPNFLVDGENVQDYLQNHYLQAQRLVAERVKDMPHVIGFDTLNEPSRGWIGTAMEDKRDTGESAMPGYAFSPFDCLRVARGQSVEIPNLDFSLWQFKMVPQSTKLMNPKRISIWIGDDGGDFEDPFEKAGAWKYKKEGGVILNKDHFTKFKNGETVDFDKHAILPFYHKVADNIRSIRSDWLVFIEREAAEAIFHPAFVEGDYPKQIVNATHWYDGATLALKKFIFPITMDPFRKKLVLGASGVEEMYTHQLGKVKHASKQLNGGCPTLIGEFGIPFDLDERNAYKKWAGGDRSEAAWDTHILALDLMYNAMDNLLINSTQWNYTATNRNSARIGDGWNQEDLSIFSLDQYEGADKENIDRGGRGLAGIVRPFPHFVQGIPKISKWNKADKEYTLVYTAIDSIPQPTQIFVPALQFSPGGRRVEVSVDGPARVVLGDRTEVKIAVFDQVPDNQLIDIRAIGDGLVSVMITSLPPVADDSQLTTLGLFGGMLLGTISAYTICSMTRRK